jgi:hypothetical protein
MSDVGIAPAPASAPASAPSAPPSAPAREVAVDPSPTTIPSPVGPQAPSKPAEPNDRRAAITKAFERARTEPPPATRARPGMGHNQPPEPMKKEAPAAAEKIDLKKRPDQQPMPRAEHGHFAAKASASPSAPPRQSQPGTAQPTYQAAPPLPAHAPYREPLGRMDERAKAEWAATPESVRGSMYRMHAEFSKAYQRFQNDHKIMRSIRPFHRMARAQGTTLRNALTNYVGIEQKLRTDPIAGLDNIVNNLNLRTRDGQQLGLRDIAWHILNQTPDQHRALQAQNTQTALGQQLGRLSRQQGAIAQQMQQLHYERQFAHTRWEVDRFAETHPRLDELSERIAQELRLGFDLPTAYARADRLHPATHAAQTRTTTATAQTRSSDRSISGAPVGGSSNGARRQRGSATARDAVSRAIQRVNGV